MTETESRALGNRMKQARPEEYLRLRQEKAERQRAKWFASKEYARRKAR